MPDRKDPFGRAAAHYDDHATLQQVVREEALSLAQACWEDESAILDVGCGTGNLQQEINALGLNWQVTGLEFSPGMCAVAKTRLPVVNADAAAMPFADNSFDGIFSSLMLQWAPDPLATLREMARVTASGGVCVVTTFTEGTLQELRQAFATIDQATHVNHFIHARQLSALAVHAGFMLLSGEEETITAHYPDAVSLMRSIRAIGAGTKLGETRKGLMTQRQLARLEQSYRQQFGGKKGLPATWQVMYMILEKP